MVKTKDHACTLPREKDMEQAAALLIMPVAHGSFDYLIYRWGVLDGKRVFDTIGGLHIEVSENQPFILQVPPKGKTFELDDHNLGQLRDLKRESSLLVN